MVIITACGRRNASVTVSVGLLLSLLLCGTAFGDESNAEISKEPIPEVDLSARKFLFLDREIEDPQTKKKRKAEFTEYLWRRPPEVAFVLVTGCGGGGTGGLIPPQGIGTPAQPRGGSSAQITTLLAGPLSEASYKVRVGRNGVATEMSGSDLHLIFSPGRTKAAASRTGEASVFGAGGAVGKDAVAHCAGGGGANSHDNVGIGGRGFLILQPMIDFSRLADPVDQLSRLP